MNVNKLSPNEVSFFLNGKPVTIKEAAPDMLLIDYLRSPEVALVGPKKPCGQGGCGGCTVILSHWNEEKREPEHRAINSCLRPVCALGGLVVTTVEGTGGVRNADPEFLLHTATSSRGAAPIGTPEPEAAVKAGQAAVKKSLAVSAAVTTALDAGAAPCVTLVKKVEEHPSELEHDGMNPVAHCLAMNNGSQCGYCSVGFVMNMSEFIINNPKATKKEIEEAFDGNLCRCTGYRSIMTGMKTFASDWSAEDEANRMKCLADGQSASQLPGTVEIPFPKAAQRRAQPVQSAGERQVWVTPLSLAELAGLMQENRDKAVRLVHGNTSFGIYTTEYPATRMFVDIRLIPELQGHAVSGKDELVIGAGNTYNDLLELTGAELQRRGPRATALVAIHYMARRTAGRIVRNAASLGGNTMLVLKHIAGKQEPFPSDLFTTMVAVGAVIEYVKLSANGVWASQSATAGELTAAVVAKPALADEILLVRYRLPLSGDNDCVLAQKVALREVNSHTIVNSTTRFRFKGRAKLEDLTLVFGGIAPFPWHAAKTQELMRGRTLDLASIPEWAQLLAKETAAELKKWAPRMQGLPSEGYTDEYRIQLVLGFFYKAVVHALGSQKVKVPANVASSGVMMWGNWPVSDGVQSYANQDWKKPVAQPYIKTTAMLQTSGRLRYTHEVPVPAQALNAAFVQSRRALATCWLVLPGTDKKTATTRLRDHLSKYADSFVDLITSENIKKSGMNMQGMGADQPLLANGQVSYVGQAIALVLAETEQEAQRIADYVSEHCVAYGTFSWPEQWNKAPFNQGAWLKPVLTLDEAISLNSIYPDTPSAAVFLSHIWKIIRPGSRFDWTREKDHLDRSALMRPVVLDGVPCLVVENTQTNGGQAHFYMEPQACVVLPEDEGHFTVRPSTQSPAAIHQTTAMALGLQYNHINVDIPPVGGGFGGKTEQTRFVAGPAAIAAQATKRPVRLVVPRDTDTGLIGKRHAYYGQYQIAVDQGKLNPADKGRILGFQTKMWGDGGAFYDCSFVVSNCIQLRTDNAYKVPNFESQIDVCRTNTAPSTAFRSFGDVQCKNIIENAVDDAAYAIGMLPEDLREKNLYDRGDVTPFGQALSYCYIKQVWAYLKEKSDYAKKRKSVDDYNRKNKWRKQGLAMMPVKYGSGYNLKLLEQAAAYVVVNQADGSLVVHQGGVEIGQGLATQVLQVAAYVMNLPMSLITVRGVQTQIIPNPTSTGASAGTPYSCEAVKQTCQVLRARLMEFGYEMLNKNGADWCARQGIDFWNYGEAGWSAVAPSVPPPPTTTETATSTIATPTETVTTTTRTIETASPPPHKKAESGSPALIWQKLVNLAYSNRVNLMASFSTKIEGGTTQVPAMTFKPQDQQPDLPGVVRNSTIPLGGGVDSFVGFTYSAALSVVEVDILTGEVKILSSDLVYDMGWSMNPAIDIGQVEGAFIQGVGYLLTEKLVFEPQGAEEEGRLNTTNTWRYKIPAITEIPLNLNVHLFPRDLAADVPDETNDIFSAKEVGEPPLVLANTVFLAVKAAIRASRVERGLDGLFRFDAPATVQEVRSVCEVSIKDLA